MVPARNYPPAVQQDVMFLYSCLHAVGSSPVLQWLVQEGVDSFSMSLLRVPGFRFQASA